MNKKLHLDRFKLRVWLGNLKEPKMVYSDYQGYMFGLLGDIWNGTLPDGVIPMECTGVRDITKWEDLDESERTNWVIAGRKSEEYYGRLVYEGDIIEGYAYDYFAGGFVKSTKIIVSDNIGGFSFSSWDMGTLKILGNMHQHPHLIEKTKVGRVPGVSDYFKIL